MLKLIDPSSHEKYQEEIDDLLSIFKGSLPKNCQPSLEEKEKNVYIIAEDSDFGVYGGALLRKKPFCDFDDQIKMVLSLLHSHKRKVWSVQFCTCLQEYVRMSQQDRIYLLKAFYSKLYKKLLVFGKQHKAKFLVVSLRQPDYAISTLFLEWPYVLEVLPEGEDFPFFHGILDIRPGDHEVDDCFSIKYWPSYKGKKRQPHDSVKKEGPSPCSSDSLRNQFVSPQKGSQEQRFNSDDQGLSLEGLGLEDFSLQDLDPQDLDSKDLGLQGQTERFVP